MKVAQPIILTLLLPSLFPLLSLRSPLSLLPCTRSLPPQGITVVMTRWMAEVAPCGGDGERHSHGGEEVGWGRRLGPVAVTGRQDEATPTRGVEEVVVMMQHQLWGRRRRTKRCSSQWCGRQIWQIKAARSSDNHPHRQHVRPQLLRLNTSLHPLQPAFTLHAALLP